jgi:hypothetical protein
MPFESHDWSLPYADMCQENPNQHHPHSDRRLHHLHYVFPLPNDLSMPPYIFLLDAKSRSQCPEAHRLRVYPARCYCKLDICAWSLECSCGLDTRHSTDFLGVEFEHESADQDLSGAHLGSWSSVS